MGFLEELQTHYGKDTQLLFKEYGNTTRKLANFENHRKFLLQCRKTDVLPSHILQLSKSLSFLLTEDSPFINEVHQALVRFQRAILNIDISYAHWKYRQLNSKLNTLKENITQMVPDNIAGTFISKQSEFYNKESNKVKQRQKRKLKSLISKQRDIELSSNPNYNNKWLINLSNVEIPPNVKYLLSLGDKFNLPYSNNNLPLESLLTDTEYAITRINEEENKNECRNKCINILTNFINKQRNIKQQNPLQAYLKETKRFFKQHNNLIICKADKGNTTVILNETEYHLKANSMLSDSLTYRKLTTDPTSKVQNKNNKLIQQLIKSNKLDPQLGKSLKCNNGIFPKMYFLPKIHKKEIPLRPILCFVGSPTYNLSKHLSSLLTYCFDKDETYVKNSFEFVQFIKNFQLPDNYVLISLDVVNLFTNIPVDLTITHIKQSWDKIKPYTSLNEDDFILLFEFCIDSGFFKFDGHFYQQIYGLGMGNCMSPVCSDIVMSTLIQQCLKNLPFYVPFFKRYVDDCVTAIPAGEESSILNIFNSYHEKLQFTIERENDSTLPFLDTKLIRTEGNVILTDWYQKPTFSERILNFNSHHSFKHKINIIKNLKHRATALSSPEFVNKNIKYIRDILMKNGYPSTIVDRILNSSKKSEHTNRPEPQKYYKIPYVKGLSEKLGSTLSKYSIQTAYSNENTLKKHIYTKLKDKTPKELQSNIVYKIPCSVCGKSYVGVTGRYLKQRLSEHSRDVKTLNKPNPTALVEHTRTEGHSFNFEQTEILSSQTNWTKRLFQEMIHIKTHNTVNFRKDTENLNMSYWNLIKQIPRIT